MYADLNLNSSKLEDFKPKRIFENRMLNQLRLLLRLNFITEPISFSWIIAQEHDMKNSD